MNFVEKPLRNLKEKLKRRPLPKMPKIHLPKIKLPKINWGTIVRIGALVAIFGLLFGSIVTVTLFAWYSKDLPDPSKLIDRQVAQTTKIFDRTGEVLLYEIHGDQKRTLVKLEDIPQYVLDASILLEDKSFYEHKGLSVKGIIRIAINPVLCKITANRFCAPGGSTISQQLVKNAILTNERSLSRKIKEIILTLEIERRFTKEQILQMYFNEIAFGSSNYGVEAAAQSYFRKSVKDVSIAEAATLSAITRAPSTYLNNQTALKSRRDYAINLMKEAGKITPEQATEAINTEIKLAKNITNITAPHFVFYVKEQLEKEFGEKKVEQGGLTVITTLDANLQKIAEEEVVKGVEKNQKQYNFNNAALVAQDPKTGQILAMVGSKDYFNDEIDGQVNVATSPYRQPGSSIKPIIYAAAFAMGYTPDTVLWDVNTTFPGGAKPYAPKNYDGGERGPVTLRNALQLSLNIPAVKLLYLVGMDRATEFAADLGYTTLQDKAKLGLSMVLGGGAVKLVEHVGAYGAFANDGVFNPPAAILKVTEPNGSTIKEWSTQERRVLDANIARTLTNVLTDDAARAPVFGLNSNLTLPGRPLAAKTGTTNDYVDAWTLGYTPSLVAGVWAGNTDNTKMNSAGGSRAAAPIWNAFMKRALDKKPVEAFIKPEPLPANKPVLMGYRVEVPPKADGTPGDQPSIIIKVGEKEVKIQNYGACTPVTVDKASGLLATTYTPEEYRETRFFCEAHEILHYLNKADPLGPPPANPASDPLYQVWEDALKDWATRVGLTLQAPPTEHDNVHVPGSGPSTVQIIFPQAGEALTSRSITLAGNAAGNRPVVRMDFFMSDVKIASLTPPFTGTATIPNRVSQGVQTLKARAVDDVGNYTETSTQVNLLAPITPIAVRIQSPGNGANIRTNQFPYDLTVASGPGLIALDLFITKDGGEEMMIGTQFAPAATQKVTWPAASPGMYQVKIRGREEGDVYHDSAPISITVQ